jgi:hypothetical protein
MSGNTIAGARKICCKCSADVTEAKRMKDHEGRYWCVACGEADRLHKLHGDMGICEGCGESVGRAQLMEIAGQCLCPSCRKHKFARGRRERQGGGLLGSIKSLFGK